MEDTLAARFGNGESDGRREWLVDGVRVETSGRGADPGRPSGPAGV